MDQCLLGIGGVRGGRTYKGVEEAWGIINISIILIVVVLLFTYMSKLISLSPYVPF